MVGFSSFIHAVTHPGSHNSGSGGGGGGATPTLPTAAPNVSSGEACTIDQLKELGIFNNLYYINPNDKKYHDLRTFNKAKDNAENRKKSLCKETLKGDAANVSCLYEHGGGYVRKPGDPDSCITYDCPPGFERQGNNCKKILLDAKIDKRSHCDERWYDWFTIPNTHLGNGYYEQSVGQCFSPCPSNYVPNYATDPVDNSKTGFMAADKLGRCVAKNQYFSGKYADAAEYCPLAVIHQLSSTPRNVATKLDKIIRTANKGGIPNDNFRNLLKSIPDQAAAIARKAAPTIDDVKIPQDDAQAACTTQYTEDKLLPAYSLCKALQKHESTVKAMFSADHEDVQTEKISMLKQACNGVFCSDMLGEDTALDLVGADEPICFKNVDPVNKDAVKKVQTDGGYPDDEIAPTADDSEAYLYTSLRVFIYLIVVPIMIVLGYLLLKTMWWVFRQVALYIWNMGPPSTSQLVAKVFRDQAAATNDKVANKFFNFGKYLF